MVGKMRLSKEDKLSHRLPGAKHPLADRVKTLTGLLSKRLGFFLLFNLCYAGVFSLPLAELFRFSLQHQYSTHVALIPLISAYLLSTHRQTLLAQAVYCPRGGITLGLLGVLCYLLGLGLQPTLSQNDFFTLTALGMVLLWIGGFVMCFGLQAVRTALFPLGFLFFAVPLPDALLSRVITALQYGSVEVTSFLFRLTPVPVFREGIRFALPGLDLEVARECSSIRSSLALLLTCVLANHLFLRHGWSKTATLLLVFPLAVFKNGVRIVTLSLLTLYVDEGFMKGGLHTRGGVVFFALSLAILLLIIFGLRQIESKRRRGAS
jgi:exosortase